MGRLDIKTTETCLTNMTCRLLPVLGDQLSFNLASLHGLDTKSDTVLLAEVMEEASHVPHHPQKLCSSVEFGCSTLRSMIQKILHRCRASYGVGRHSCIQMKYT